jgi:hypothetical protein
MFDKAQVVDMLQIHKLEKAGHSLISSVTQAANYCIHGVIPVVIVL